MSSVRHASAGQSDTGLAFQMVTIAPALGGIVLRGGGSQCEDWLDAARQSLFADVAWCRLPSHVDQERLSGGIDLAATLAAGRPIRSRGLLADLEDGVLVVPLAHKIEPSIAGQLAQRLDSGDGKQPTVFLIDEASTDEPGPPPSLCDRLAFTVDLNRVRPSTSDMALPPDRLLIDHVAPLAAEACDQLAAIAMALGVVSIRALNFAATAARASAALNGRTIVSSEDLDCAVRLVLAPRATQLPAVEAEPPPPEQTSAETTDRQSDDAPSGGEMQERILAATLASLPDGLLDSALQRHRARKLRGGGQGSSGKSTLRGRPMGAKQGRPSGGARLALIDTLRAAVLWQSIRRAEAGGDRSGLIIRRDDLRVRRFKEKTAALTIFCVDASGSAALARLAEAKGAVERLLAQAYVKRSEVALIAFRGERAELLLPPTRSLTRARRVLSQLPGGGGTPLASGILLTSSCAAKAAAAGRSPLLVFLTDGSANIALDGSPGRQGAQEDAARAARLLAADGHVALVIDISPRPRPAAEDIAAAMRARYLPLPAASAEGIERAVEATRQSVPA